MKLLAPCQSARHAGDEAACLTSGGPGIFWVTETGVERRHVGVGPVVFLEMTQRRLGIDML